jgi:anti-sigma-K factor RskA
MSITPVDDHTDEFEQLAALAALGALEGEERARYQQHAAQCERCQVMVRLDREALAALALVAPEMDASPGFKERLMRRAAQELTQSSTEAVEPEPILLQPRPKTIVRFWRRSRWANALAAVLVIGLVMAGALTYENQPVASYELTGSLPGSAKVIVRRSGAAELHLAGLPAPGSGLVYEAWVIPAGQEKPLPVDTTPRGDATIPLPDTIKGGTVAITRERARSDVPTPPILLSTVVTL